MQDIRNDALQLRITFLIFWKKLESHKVKKVTNLTSLKNSNGTRGSKKSQKGPIDNVFGIL